MNRCFCPTPLLSAITEPLAHKVYYELKCGVPLLKHWQHISVHSCSSCRLLLPVTARDMQGSMASLGDGWRDSCEPQTPSPPNSIFRGGTPMPAQPEAEGQDRNWKYKRLAFQLSWRGAIRGEGCLSPAAGA